MNVRRDYNYIGAITKDFFSLAKYDEFLWRSVKSIYRINAIYHSLTH